MIPRFKPWLGREELTALLSRTDGAVERFEEEFARTFGAAEAVAFPHGRSALWAFLKALGISDAEVIMPAYTCSVVAHAISLSGNRPRFIDISLTDYNMDLDLLAEAISDETRAVVATHLFGYPLDLDRLEGIVQAAERKHGHKIWLIQDCAHSFGATWKGRRVGASGDVALYALNVSKIMTAVFGGMLTFQDRDLALRVRGWRNAHFANPSFLKPILRRLYLVSVYLAFNEFLYTLTYWLQEKTPLLSRMTESYHLDDKIHFPPDYMEHMLDVEAEVGLKQLKKYPTNIARRRENAAYFDANLVRRVGTELPPLRKGATYSHYVIRVHDRAQCVEAMARKGVQVGELIQYSVPLLASYEQHAERCPNAAAASVSTINLPIGPAMTVAKRQMVRDAFNSL